MTLFSVIQISKIDDGGIKFIGKRVGLYETEHILINIRGEHYGSYMSMEHIGEFFKISI